MGIQSQLLRDVWGWIGTIPIRFLFSRMWVFGRPCFSDASLREATPYWACCFGTSRVLVLGAGRSSDP